MNEEIALDPASAPSPRELSKLIRFAFGPFRGKYLSDFPQNDWWVAYTAHTSQTEQYLIPDLRKRWQLACHQFGRHYDQASDWPNNAEKEHARRPFYAIVSSKVGRGVFKSVDDDGFLERIERDTAGQRFDATSSIYSEFAQVLVQRGPEVVLCDSYLSKLDAHDRSAVLTNLLGCTIRSRCTDFTVITRVQDGESPEHVMSRFESVAKSAPRACRFRVLIVNRRAPDTHKRFLLTRFGALVFDRGFEVPPTRKNDVTIMPKETHDDYVDEFITRRQTWSNSVAKQREWAMPLAR